MQFLDGDRLFDYVDWKYEGYADKLTHEKTKLVDIDGKKNRLKYFLARYTFFFEVLYKLKND